jgi:catechol 2,3-dioxygenase-like lactoylglutathione lyase family enzyme
MAGYPQPSRDKRKQEGSMRVSHVALVSSSEDKADRFYQGVLGLKRTRTVSVSADVMNSIFGLNQECKKTDYEDGGIRFEIFLTGQEGLQTTRPDHVCLEVDDVEAFLKNCEAMKVEVIRVAKGESVVIFIKDYDGSFFEIKGKK